MSILTDALIDAKADLCWNHQQEQLLGKVKINCICGQLADMIYLTRQEIAKEIEQLRCDTGTCTDDRRGFECLQKNALLDLAAMIARGNDD